MAICKKASFVLFRVKKLRVTPQSETYNFNFGNKKGFFSTLISGFEVVGPLLHSFSFQILKSILYIAIPYSLFFDCFLDETLFYLVGELTRLTRAYRVGKPFFRCSETLISFHESSADHAVTLGLLAYIPEGLPLGELTGTWEGQTTKVKMKLNNRNLTVTKQLQES